MKKLLVLMGLATAAFSFTGCQKNEMKDADNDLKGTSTFELVADIAQTKTTLTPDTYAVDWEEGDIIYMVTKDEEWGAAYSSDNNNVTTIAEFVYADGKFVTESTISGGEHTFYAMYSRGDQKTWHRGAGSSHSLLSTQSQDCSAPTAHIKLNDALVGTFTATTPMTEPAKVDMHHLYTMMQVDVMNNTGTDIEVTKFEMTAAGADLAGVFNVESFEKPSISTNSGASSTITVNVTNGTVEAGKSLPVYFIMAPLSNYSGDVTFKVTDASGNTYTKTVTLSNMTFAAGKYNTTPYTISSADVVEPEPANVTWDLTQASYSSANTDKVTWTSDYVNLSLEQGNSKTLANNYLGGTNDNDHTRVYKDQIMTFAPVGKYQIEKIEYFATEAGYVDKLTNSTWTNANVSSSERTVTVLPDDGHSDVSVIIGEATRFTAITVYYSLDEDYVLPTVKSLVVSGQTTEFVQNATFSFDGTVTAIYTNDKAVDVTGNVTVSTPDLTTTGTKEVTVTYMDGETPVTAIYEITVVEASAVSGWILTSFADLKEGDQVVIVGIKSSTQYAMSNDKGTGSGPVPVIVATSGNKLANDPATNIVWYVGEDGNNRIFYATAAKDKWLYCTNSNNGVRVGDNVNKTFTWSNDYLKHIATSRYLGIYNTQDWRCYTEHTAANIANQTFQFYVKVGGSNEGTEEPDPTPTPVELVMSDITCSNQTENSLTFTWTAVEGATAYQVYFDGKDKGQTTDLTYTASDLIAGTSYTIAVKAVGDEVNYTTSTSAKTCTASTTSASQGGEDPVQSITVSKTIAEIADANSWSNSEQYKTINLDDVITATVAGGGNTGKYYTSGNNWRLYQNETPSLTISASDGYTIKTVKITYSISNTGILTHNSSNITSGTEVTVNAASISFGVGNNTETVTNGQVRVTAIEVVYQAN